MFEKYYAVVVIIVLFFTVAYIIRLNRSLTKANRELLDRSRTDPLTGWLKEDYFNIVLPKIVAMLPETRRGYCVDASTPVISLLIISIDPPKEGGSWSSVAQREEVVKRVTFIVLPMLKASSLVTHTDGGELIVALPNVSEEDVVEVAEAMRIAVFNQDFGTNYDESISIGMFSFYGLDKYQEARSNAVKALNDAKKSGGNKVMMYQYI